MPSQIYKKFIWAGIATATVLAVGTIGYWFIGGQRYSILDCLYMTVITVLTIGFGEIIDLSDKPGGRVFTMFIALFGVGTLTYILSSFTAFVVEGELKEIFGRRRMEKAIEKLRHHYIVCGVDRVGFYIAHELHQTNRPYILIDVNREKIERAVEAFREQLFVEGDATDDSTLRRAGIEEARGVFAVTGDDNKNIVISLTAKQLNPRVRVVARCHEIRNVEKMKKAGADAVVSPDFIGGLRMASEMVRPAVVTFLDMMLRDRDKNLRIEEVAVPDAFGGNALSDLGLKRFPHLMLLAVRTGEDWLYNPPEDYVVSPGSTLIFMTTPKERFELKEIFKK